MTTSYVNLARRIVFTVNFRSEFRIESLYYIDYIVITSKVFADFRFDSPISIDFPSRLSGRKYLQTLEVITPEFRFESPISIQGLVESLKKL